MIRKDVEQFDIKRRAEIKKTIPSISSLLRGYISLSFNRNISFAALKPTPDSKHLKSPYGACASTKKSFWDINTPFCESDDYNVLPNLSLTKWAKCFGYIFK